MGGGRARGGGGGRPTEKEWRGGPGRGGDSRVALRSIHLRNFVPSGAAHEAAAGDTLE